VPERVAAVVVTHNRRQLLTQCLAALLAQSRPLEGVIVVDNASSDGTPELLRERGFIDHGLLQYLRLDRNLGGAGGFRRGLQVAHEGGFDWTWLMDDDAEPSLAALDLLSPAFLLSDAVAAASLPIDETGRPQYHHRGWGRLCDLDPAVVRGVSDRDLQPEFVEIDQASFVGLAVSRRAVEAVGLPLAEFFLHHDDFEYCRRIRRVGRIWLATRSLIKHAERQREDAYAVFALGRPSSRLPLDRLWLAYYSLRNSVWLKRQSCSPLSTLAFIAKFVVRKWLGILLYDDHKLRRMNFYLQSAWDGWRGRFDNEKPKRILGIGGALPG